MPREIQTDLFGGGEEPEPVPVPAKKEPPQPRVFTPGELNGAIRLLLENNFPLVWVRGEVSNLRRQPNGHCYFSLKDAAGQISAVIFRAEALRLRVELKDGAQLLVSGEISAYEARGTYQIIIRQVVEDGQGRLQAELEKLRQKLAAEGLFERARKKPLPLRARVIGIITSPTGAALQDFIRILQRRGWTGRLIVLPARVQGVEAVGDILAMMRAADALPELELLVLARGGGSLEDLWCFNDERLVRAVAAFRLPTISAIGHEVDFTLCDFAAGVRAETPSGAAELISSGAIGYQEKLADLRARLDDRLDSAVAQARERLSWIRRAHAQVSPERTLERAHLRLDDVSNRLESVRQRIFSEGREKLSALRLRLRELKPDTRLGLARQQLASLRHRWSEVPLRQLPGKARHLRQLALRLKSSGPAATLSRGFAMVRGTDGALRSDASALKPGEHLVIVFRDGEIRATVDSKKL